MISVRSAAGKQRAGRPPPLQSKVQPPPAAFRLVGAAASAPPADIQVRVLGRALSTTSKAPPAGGTMKIAAIETRYAGCRFRSRLEARWAVFFDRLGVAWEYEPQGFMVGRVEADPHFDLPAVPGRPYLPDFWLPAEQLWVEVKGSEEGTDYPLLLDAAIPHWGLPSSLGLLILGPLPRPGGRFMHSCLQFYKGIVDRNWAEFTVDHGILIHESGPLLGPNGGEHRFGGDSGDIAGNGHVKPLDPSLTSTLQLPRVPYSQIVDRAYVAARSARFEHGESGA